VFKAIFYLRMVPVSLDGIGAMSKLPNDSISLCVSGVAFGGKLDSAQSRLRFRAPPPQEAEQKDHGSQEVQTPNLPR